MKYNNLLHCSKTILIVLKKYLKKLNSINHYDNFTDIVIDIDWKSINYNRISFINKAVHKFNNCKYLEIGCQNNDCFDSIDAKSKIGVDPNKGGTIRSTSDDFFTKNESFFDVIFIDGLHTFEQCRKDIINSLKFLNYNGYIFIHDLIPRSWLEENVPRLQAVWTGDVWKVSLELNKTDGINFSVILADSGVGMISKKTKDVTYYDDYLQLKGLKFKDFLNRVDEINFIDSEQSLNILEND